MKLRSLLAVLALIVGVVVAAPINAEEKNSGKEAGKVEKGAAKEEDGPPDFEVLFKDVDKVIGTVNYTADDVKTFKDQWTAGADLLKDDAEFQKLKKKSIKEAFDYAVKHASVLEWAKEKKLDADTYMRKSLRIMLQHVKQQIPDQVKAGRESLENARKMVETYKDALGEEKYNEQIKKLDEATKMLDGMEKGFDLIPNPTDDEKKLLEANKDDIQKIVEKDNSSEPKKEPGNDGKDSGGKDSSGRSR